ncbi:hypothetical protein [Saccharibacillus kuerlensis]|uniref:Lipoprotein n=1 Tax=Saccharibacillus kuerlensis TaxID=459527 RepID=A0ABQ2L6D6_9BACL|nr:hypothetical protein [Saccharibacillus kuerlensis]GGO04939.1 hypothetical protein GCM10010969_30760 [Saccharibacillus kuerlensis]
MKKLKNKNIITLLSMLMILLTGCTNPVRISSDQIKEFREQIQEDYASIKEIRLEFMPTTIYMYYEMKDPVTEEEKKEIFEQSRELLMSDTFDQEVIQAKFHKKYSSSGHPNFEILFDDGTQKVMSSFSIQANDSEDADEVYTQWYYSKGGDVPGELGEPYSLENK